MPAAHAIVRVAIVQAETAAIATNLPTPSRGFVFLGVFAIIRIMKYRYKIILDKERDAWNWFDASQKPSFQGCSWRNFLHNQDLEFFDNIVKLPPQNAKQKINHYLTEKYNTNKNLFVERTKLIDEKLDEKFLSACKWLEKTTGHPLFFHNYIIYLTTFPRSPYDAENGSFFINIYKQSGLINVFLHEGLHFQFINYWRNNKKTLVSQMSKDKFETLKEALTVIIDEDAVPPADYPDKGYIASHQKIRESLHAEWKKTHNFDALTEYGVKLLE